MAKVASIDSSGGNNYAKKGHDYDPYLRSFMIGVGGEESNWETILQNLRFCELGNYFTKSTILRMPI